MAITPTVAQQVFLVRVVDPLTFDNPNYKLVRARTKDEAQAKVNAWCKKLNTESPFKSRQIEGWVVEEIP